MTTLAVALFATLVCTMNAAASDGIDVPPERLANALGVSTTAAGYILGIGFMAAVIVAAAIAGAPPEATAFLGLGVCVVLVVIGWVEYWLLLLGAFLVIVMFVAPISRKLAGGA